MNGTADASGGPVRSELELAGFTPEYLSHNGVLPLRLNEDALEVAIAGSPAVEVIDDLEVSYALPVRRIPVTAEALQDGIRRAFSDAESVVELIRGVGDTGDAAEAWGNLEADARDLANQPPVIRFVNLLIRDAHQARASDIHIESTDTGIRIRLRIDGVLGDVIAPPRSLEAAIVSRIKLLGALDIAERRVPQDGRVRVRLEDRELDVRISSVPTITGESVVLRLLDRGGVTIGLDDLGMDPITLEAFQRLAQRPHGVILATGPTGSGKTTTLYSALALRDAATEKIVTVEDPVEYQLRGVTQVPINVRSGMTFAGALRSLLRQDPNVLMIGEMRDTETAAIAMQAAITGHLVFSTLHTNDSVAAISRLLDLKVEAYMVASSVDAILAQRLVRKICCECRASYKPDPEAVALLARRPVGNMNLARGTGCDSCRNTGYKGRTGIFELFLISDEWRRQIVEKPGDPDRRRRAIESGMRTLRDDGWAKVQAGITTIEEVLRVTQ